MSVKSLGEPIALGYTAEVYSWNEEYVLKLFHEWFPPDRARYEARIARVVQNAGLPVPAVGEMIEVDGRLGLIYERVVGPSMLDVLTAKPWLFLHLARRLAELQTQMHDIEGVGELPSQHDKLREKIQAAPMLSSGLRKAVLDALDKLTEESRLCHGDFHPGNILMTGKGTVVIDWIDVSRGNPVGDIARSSLLIEAGVPPEGTPMKRLIDLLRGWLHDAYLRRAAQLFHWDSDEFVTWNTPSRLCVSESFAA